MSCAARVSRVVPLHTHHCQIGDDKGQKWPLQCAAFLGASAVAAAGEPEDSFGERHIEKKQNK